MAYEQFHEQWNGQENYIKRVIAVGQNTVPYGSGAVRYDCLIRYVVKVVIDNTEAISKLKQWAGDDEDRQQSIDGVLKRIEGVNEELNRLRQYDFRNNPVLDKYTGVESKTIGKRLYLKEQKPKSPKNPVHKACNGF